MPHFKDQIVEPSPKRVRVIVSGKTVADSLAPLLLIEGGQHVSYYFPMEDVRADYLEGTNRHVEKPFGEALCYTLNIGGRKREGAAWRCDEPSDWARRLGGHVAFDPGKVDHWFEEDEEVLGHPRNPYHRIDVRRSTREVRVRFNGEVIANTHRGLFLFETGLPTRY
ncbi:MAG: DUF427 domain-containing protein [Bauldia sp.]